MLRGVHLLVGCRQFLSWSALGRHSGFSVAAWWLHSASKVLLEASKLQPKKGYRMEGSEEKKLEGTAAARHPHGSEHDWTHCSASSHGVMHGMWS